MRAFALATFAAGILATAPVPASAAQIVRNFTITISGSTDQDFDSTQFPKFDQSLGTLTKVNESLTGSATWSPGDPGEILTFILQSTSASQHFSASPTGGDTPIDVGMNGVSVFVQPFEGLGPFVETLTSVQSPGSGTLSRAVLNGTMTYNYTPFVGSPVPEPSTWAMMLLGFTGLGYAALKRKGAALTVSA
jgi:hypothetical protein